MIKKVLLGLAVVAVAGAGIAFAQQTGIKRTPLQKLDFPAGYNTVTAIAEVPAGGAAGRHTHPGAETGYVLEGELELVIDGQTRRVLLEGRETRAVLDGVPRRPARIEVDPNRRWLLQVQGVKSER